MEKDNKNIVPPKGTKKSKTKGLFNGVNPVK